LVIIFPEIAAGKSLTRSLAECTGLLWALMLSATRKVRRSDGSKVATSPGLSWGGEFAALGKHIQRKKVTILQVSTGSYN